MDLSKFLKEYRIFIDNVSLVTNCFNKFICNEFIDITQVLTMNILLSVVTTLYFINIYIIE